MDDYTNQSSYLEKKIDDWGLHGKRKKYEEHRKMELQAMVRQCHFDLILWINSPAGVLSLEEFSALGKKIKQVIWYVDGISGQANVVPYAKKAYKIGCLEYKDVDYFRGIGVKNAVYCPVGYNEAYGNVENSCKTIDVSFVGSPFKNRLRLLEGLAKAAGKFNWKLEFYGPFWESMYFWKSVIFRYKYPNMYRFIHNGSLLPEEVAEIYSRSKICLNIHDEKHKSPNPRFFEIIQAGAMQLCDVRDNYVRNLVPPKALDVFENEESLISKVKYYLQNENKRQLVADYGRSKNVWSMQYSLRILLENVIDF